MCKRLLVTGLALLWVSVGRSDDFALRVSGYLAQHGTTIEEARDRGVLLVLGPGGTTGKVVGWNAARMGFLAPTVDVLPSEQQAQIAIAALAATKENQRRVDKPEALKKAERRVIQFLRSEGVIPTNAVSVTLGQLDTMFDSWATSAETGKSSEAPANAKAAAAHADAAYATYERLMRHVRLLGGTDTDVYFQK